MARRLALLIGNAKFDDEDFRFMMLLNLKTIKENFNMLNQCLDLQWEYITRAKWWKFYMMKTILKEQFQISPTYYIFTLHQ